MKGIRRPHHERRALTTAAISLVLAVIIFAIAAMTFSQKSQSASSDRSSGPALHVVSQPGSADQSTAIGGYLSAPRQKLPGVSQGQSLQSAVISAPGAASLSTEAMLKNKEIGTKK